MTSTWKLFCRTMRVMGKRRFLYYGAILGMSAGMAMFSVLGSLLMKSVVDVSQSRDYSSLGVTVSRIASAVVVSLLVYGRGARAYYVEAKRADGVMQVSIQGLEIYVSSVLSGIRVGRGALWIGS